MNVDVIIPVYNSSKYLEDALASCMTQTYKTFKVFVVDDNSEEDIKKVVNKFSNVLDIEYIRNEKNYGPSRSRNIAIKKGKGDLISFLDADDVWDENKLLNSVNVFYLDKKVGMTCGNYRVWVNRKTVLGPFYKKRINVNYDSLKKVNYVASGSVTVRRSVLNDIGLFNESYKVAEDYDLWVRISKKYKIFYIDRVLYLYSRVKDGDL
jgi:glycosyltransferase involved in cell wall biosynthesis